MDEAPRSDVIEVLYLFSGAARSSDFSFFLNSYSHYLQVPIALHEVDILRQPQAHDLSDQQVWNRIFSDIQQGRYLFVIMAPPCSTFSRARHEPPGPKPLRTSAWPRGFPWLTKSERNEVTLANMLIDRVLQAATEQVRQGQFFVIEHPEQLGVSQGMVPASVWDWPEMRALVNEAQAGTFALHQCQFGAATCKPTRFVTNAQNYILWPGLHWGWHQLGPHSEYVGPLPPPCPKGSHDIALKGKTATAWRTSSSAAYPPALCAHIAQLVISACTSTVASLKGVWATEILHNLSSSEGEDSDDSDQDVQVPVPGSKGDGKTSLSPVPYSSTTHRHSETAEYPFHGLLKQAAVDNRGMPMTCRWQNRIKSFTDGGGLNSPGRWHPSDRARGIGGDRREFILSLRGIVTKFVNQHLEDPKKEMFRLATGRYSDCPFTDQALGELREEWFKLLGDSPHLREVPPHQPFFLAAIEATLVGMGDEDTEILTKSPGDNYRDGRMVGVGEAIPTAPLVFRPKVKTRKYDESDYTPVAANYSSAKENGATIESQFRDEERLGWMYPLSLAEAQRRFGSKLRVASLAAIPKDESSVRVIFDGTHHIRVNNEIIIHDQLEFPGPGDIAKVMDVCQNSDCGVVLSLAADIAKAHRRYLHRPQDHGYLCCRSDDSSDVVWVNRVGTFGVACAALHFGRLAALLFRLVIRLMLDSFLFQLLFADDLKFLVSGPNKYTDFWVMLVTWLMCGAPMSWKKFRGGLELDFVGFFTDYGRFELGLSEKRATWVMQVLRGLVENKYVITGYAFAELVGRLGFASQAVPWIRPLLAPLYAWGSKFKGGTVSRVPDLVGHTLQLIKQRFERGLYRVSCCSPQVGREEAFRTDAKCAEGLVVVGGWAVQDGSAKQARWFALQLGPEQAPWLFERSLSAQRMSTTAEIFAIYVGLHVFGYLKRGERQLQKPGAALIASGTDNLAAEHLSRRRLSTKMPLGLLLAQMNTNLWDAGLWLEARWRPREQNIEADDLTNSIYEKFDMNNRVAVKLEDIDMEIFNGLRATYGNHEQAPKFIGQVGDETRRMGRKRPPKSDW